MQRKSENYDTMEYINLKNERQSVETTASMGECSNDLL